MVVGLTPITVCVYIITTFLSSDGGSRVTGTLLSVMFFVSLHVVLNFDVVIFNHYLTFLFDCYRLA